MMKTIWQKTPTLIKAILVGIVVLIPTLLVTQIIGEFNAAVFLPNIPWSLPVIAVVVWLFYRYTTGSQTPFEASLNRNRLSKDQAIPEIDRPQLVLAIIVQVILAISLLIASTMLLDFTDRPMGQNINLYLPMSPLVAIPYFIGIAIAASVIEEIAFRGYMQTLLNDRYSKLVSIVIVGIVFAVIHPIPPATYIPFFFISISYSLIAERFNSTRPAIVSHFIVDVAIYIFGYLGFIMSIDRLSYSVLSNGIRVDFLFAISIALVSGAILWVICKEGVYGEEKELGLNTDI